MTEMSCYIIRKISGLKLLRPRSAENDVKKQWRPVHVAYIWRRSLDSSAFSGNTLVSCGTRKDIWLSPETRTKNVVFSKTKQFRAESQLTTNQKTDWESYAGFLKIILNTFSFFCFVALRF